MMTDIEYWLACWFIVCMIINIVFLFDLCNRLSSRKTSREGCGHELYVLGYCRHCDAFRYKKRIKIK